MNRRFPIYLDLNGKNIVVLGGGTIAARRIRTLSEFGPHIHVVSPEIQPELLCHLDKRRIHVAGFGRCRLCAGLYQRSGRQP